MSVTRPFRRTVRQLASGSYGSGGHWEYVRYPEYAADAWQYKRAFQIIDQEISEIFQYIEPSVQNFGCFSYRIAGLLARICIEIEANFRAILRENGYRVPPSKMTMLDYRKVEQSHFLSRYVIKLAVWHGGDVEFQPYLQWSSSACRGGPDWYQAYNSTKHDRHTHFSLDATFKNLLSAYCGLAVLIWSQFQDAEDPGPDLLSFGSSMLQTGFAFGPLKRTLIKPPEIPINERYDFDWQKLRASTEPVQQFSYKP